MIITSTDNPIIKSVAALKEKKYRDRENKFLAEGIFTVCDIPDVSLIDKVFVTETALTDKKVSDFLLKMPEYVVVSDRVMNKLSDTVTPQGIIAVIDKPAIPEKFSGACVVLDGIKDPGNAGTIIRTAAAIGYENVLAVNSADLYSPKVVRSTMSGIFHAKAREYANHEDLLDDLKDYSVYVLDMAGKNIFDFAPDTDNFAVCVGSEAHGVSKALFDRANESLSLPMNGKMESLNASVAASIAMYLLKKKDF